MIFFSCSLSCPNKKLTYVLFAGLVNIYICSCYKAWLNTQMRKVNAQILASVRIFSSCLAASMKISSKNLTQRLRLSLWSCNLFLVSLTHTLNLKKWKDFIQKCLVRVTCKYYFLPYLTTLVLFQQTAGANRRENRCALMACLAD